MPVCSFSRLLLPLQADNVGCISLFVTETLSGIMIYDYEKLVLRGFIHIYLLAKLIVLLHESP